MILMQFISRYFLANKGFSLFYLFLMIGLILKATTDLNITIPCLYKLTTGLDCIGCGLTTAGSQVIRLNFAGAAEANWLIFPLIIGFGIYMYVDLKSFAFDLRALKSTTTK